MRGRVWFAREPSAKPLNRLRMSKPAAGRHNPAGHGLPERLRPHVTRRLGSRAAVPTAQVDGLSSSGLRPCF